MSQFFPQAGYQASPAQDSRPPSTREIYLNAAARLTGHDRNAEYGEPFNNLSDCAELWSAYLRKKYPSGVVLITAEDVAWLNVLQKMARTFHGPGKADTYVDAAAYAAIAGECRALSGNMLA